jgi:Icc protein
VTDDLLFVQLSDTHLLADPAARLFGIDPAERLRRVLAYLDALPVAPAFVIVSGDLTHDGTLAAYRRLGELLAPLERRGLPVLLGLGNHDARPAFRATLAVAAAGPDGDSDGRCYYSHRVGDLRVLMLDSLVPGEVWGALGQAQLDWLARALRAPAPGGDLLVVHHPVTRAGVPWLDELLLVDAAALAEVVQGHPPLGILAGHCHNASASHFAGTLAATAPAVVFQFEPYPGERGQVRPGSGFNLCRAGRAGLVVSPVLLPEP